jgi:hypothetical protein
MILLKTKTININNNKITPLTSFHCLLVPRNNNNLIHEKVGNGNDEQLMHLTVNNKTLQFISPLETQSNAKRQ